MRTYLCDDMTDTMDVDFGIWGTRECFFTFKESVEGPRDSFPTVSVVITKMEIWCDRELCIKDRTDMIDSKDVRRALESKLQTKREKDLYAEEMYGIMEKSGTEG